MYHSVFILSVTVNDLSCFQSLSFGDKNAMDIFVQVLQCICVHVEE